MNCGGMNVISVKEACRFIAKGLQKYAHHSEVNTESGVVVSDDSWLADAK